MIEPNPDLTGASVPERAGEGGKADRRSRAQRTKSKAEFACRTTAARRTARLQRHRESDL